MIEMEHSDRHESVEDCLVSKQSLLVLNINSSHLLVPMPTMNNRGSTQLCQHSELLIHNHRLALAHSVRYSLHCGVRAHLPA